MFESRGVPVPGSGACAAPGPVDAATVQGWQQTLAAAIEDGTGGLDDAARIDLIRALEALKCTAEAGQAAATVDLDASQRSTQAAVGVSAERQGRGVAAQVALARRESHHRGRQHLGLAKILHAEMPHTWAAFKQGLIPEWHATILVRETACLPVEHRATVDRALAADGEALSGYGTGELQAAARKLACRLDPAAVAARRRRAESERRVTVRAAPDTMGYLSCLLPVAQAVAVYAALGRHADTLRAAGDPRGRGQIMADTLVERATGQSTAPGVPVAINLLITARTLLAGGNDPAHLEGIGPIPADLARELVASSTTNPEVTTWLRRLFTDPTSGELVAMDTKARAFTTLLSLFLGLRDQGICRTPWCDAPIRHGDHVVPADEGGQTSEPNGQGLCEACNHAKQAPGWTARTTARSTTGKRFRHTVATTTPTGHTYWSTAPAPPGTPQPGTPQPGAPPPATNHSALETYFHDLILAS